MNSDRLRVDVGGIVSEQEADAIASFDPSGSRDTREAIVMELPAQPGDELTGRTRHEVILAGWRFEVTVESAARAALRERATVSAGGVRQAAADRIRAQLPGRIVAVLVGVGDEVTAGQPLLALEAMKMENEVRAPRAGTIASVEVEAGKRVELGDELIVLE